MGQPPSLGGSWGVGLGNWELGIGHCILSFKLSFKLNSYNSQLKTENLKLCPTPHTPHPKLLQTSIYSLLACSQLNLEDFAPHFHNPLLLAKPVIEGNQLREKGILQFSLGAGATLAGNAGCNLKHSHGLISPDSVKYS